MSSLRSPLGRVRGLGSAKEGVGHWWAQRVTAIALIPLSLWFVVSVLALAGKSYEESVSFFFAPHHAVPMVLLVVALFHHAQLGLQVVIEDYVHQESAKILLLLLVKGLAVLLGALAGFTVLKLAFGG